jgi:hypothetical protein
VSLGNASHSYKPPDLPLASTFCPTTSLSPPHLTTKHTTSLHLTAPRIRPSIMDVNMDRANLTNPDDTTSANANPNNGSSRNLGGAAPSGPRPVFSGPPVFGDHPPQMFTTSAQLLDLSDSKFSSCDIASPPK